MLVRCTHVQSLFSLQKLKNKINMRFNPRKLFVMSITIIINYNYNLTGCNIVILAWYRAGIQLSEQFFVHFTSWDNSEMGNFEDCNNMEEVCSSLLIKPCGRHLCMWDELKTWGDPSSDAKPHSLGGVGCHRTYCVYPIPCKNESYQLTVS